MAPLILHQTIGAQVLQASLEGISELFYLSPIPPKSGQAIRGGVPVLFPQFADIGPLPKHGLLRTTEWRLLQSNQSNEISTVRYRLNIVEGDFDDWPYSCNIELDVHLASTELALNLTATNNGKEGFTWTGGLHPYFAVSDLLKSRLSGLKGLSVKD